MASYTAVAGGGNWSDNATWGGAGHPIAGDVATINATMTGTVTVNAASACTTLDTTNNGGTLAFTNQILTVSGLSTLQGTMTGSGGSLNANGGVTLLSSITSSAINLRIGGASTLTSNGFTWGGPFLTSLSGTVTLKGNWVVTGLYSNTANTCTLNRTGVGDGDELACNGGITVSGALIGTTALIIGGTGKTIRFTGLLQNNLTFNCTSATIFTGGTNLYSAGTITHTAGTITTTSSTIQLQGSCGFNTSGMTWGAVTMSSTGTPTITLTSDFNCTSFVLVQNSVCSFSGAYDISVGSLGFNTGVNASALKIPSGQTLTVTTRLFMLGTYLDIFSVVSRTLQAVTASSTIYLDYLGAASDCCVVAASFVDVDASGSAQPIDDWYQAQTTGATLTRVVNIASKTSDDIGGGTTSNVFGFIG